MHPFSPPPAHILEHLATARGRVAPRRELLGLRVTDEQLGRWVADGALTRPARGWYGLPGPRSLWDDAAFGQRYLRQLDPDGPALLTGGMGLLAHGLDVDGVEEPCFAVAHGRRVRLPDPLWSTVQRTSLPPHGRHRARGLATADPARLFADAAREGRNDAELAPLLVQARTRLGIDPVHLVADLEALDEPGAEQVMRLVRAGVLEHDSMAELALFTDVFLAHPPAPDCQVYVTKNRRVDFVFLYAALIIEYHGERWHRDSVDLDTTKSFLWRTLGYDVLAIGKTVAKQREGLMGHVHDVRRQREHLISVGAIPRPPLPAQPDRLTPLRTNVPLG